MKQEGRVVLLGGGLANILVTSSGCRFIRCFTDPDGYYAEYFLHTPDELHEITSGEMLVVVRQDGMFVGYYEGELFIEDTFCIEGAF